MTDPDSLEREHTLRTAVARYEDLRTREALASAAADLAGSTAGLPAQAHLTSEVGPTLEFDRGPTLEFDRGPDPDSGPDLDLERGADAEFGPGPGVSGTPPLGQTEALELLALGEVVARKVGYGRQLTVRTARAAGASWSQIGRALGTTKQAAWEAHTRWIDALAELHRDSEHQGLDSG